MDAGRIMPRHCVLFYRRAACNPGADRPPTAALMMAYAFIGFAVLHTLTQALKSRALWLGCSYVVVVVVPPGLWWRWWFSALADAVFGIRRRFLNGRPPPLPVS